MATDPSGRRARIAPLIRSRIVGHEEVPPDQLLAHESNFRRHPGAQLDALRGSLRELGWVRSIIVSKRTGKVIDGHARIEEAMRQDLATVPVEYVDLTPEEEKLALAILDPISEMATHDQDAVDALIAEIQTDDPALCQLLADLETDATKKRPVTVEEVNYAEVVGDRFWLSVRGPLPEQRDVLERLRTALEELPGVEVDIGTTEG